MTSKHQAPWTSGPAEILRHGLDLLRKDTDVNRRLAMISVDNAVELMIKTYLSLPKRVTGLPISRKEFREISGSFPGLLDAMEKYAADKLDGVDLGVVEWYHGLRNQLYHEGNGLTVEREKVEIYAELANVLSKNLFGVDLAGQRQRRTELIGDFMEAWVDIERGMRETAIQMSLTGQAPTGMQDLMRNLRHAGILNQRQMQELDRLRQVRNRVIHSAQDWEMELTPEVFARLRHYADLFSSP